MVLPRKRRVTVKEAISVLDGVLVMVLGGVRAPQVMATARRAYEQERRQVRALLLPPSLAGDVGEPTDEQLQAFIAENAQIFTRPEGRRFTLVRVTPQMFQQDVDVSEDDLRELYEFRRESGELAPPAPPSGAAPARWRSRTSSR